MDVPIREAGMYCPAFASARADRAELMNLLYSRKPWPMRFFISSALSALALANARQYIPASRIGTSI